MNLKKGAIVLKWEIFFCSVLIFTCLGKAEPRFRIDRLNGTAKLQLVFDNGTIEEIAPIDILKKGTISYHWGQPATIERLNAAGRMEQSEIERLIHDPQGLRSNVGGGFYVSLDPWDSSTFGSQLAILEQKQDTYSIHSGIVFKYIRIFGDHNKLNAALAKAGISSKHGAKLFPIWEPGRLLWMNFIGQDVVTNIRRGLPADLSPLVKLESHTSDIMQLAVLGSANGFGIDIDSIIPDLIEARPLLKKIWEDQPLSVEETILIKNQLHEVVLSNSPQRIISSKFMTKFLRIAATESQEWEDALAKLKDVAEGKLRSRQLSSQGAADQIKFLRQFLITQSGGLRCLNLFH